MGRQLANWRPECLVNNKSTVGEGAETIRKTLPINGGGGGGRERDRLVAAIEHTIDSSQNTRTASHTPLHFRKFRYTMISRIDLIFGFIKF